MKRIHQTILLLFIIVQPLFSETIIGTIINETTKSPTRVEKITLYSMLESQAPIAEYKNIDANFEFKDVKLPTDSPILVQTIYKGTPFNKFFLSFAELVSKKIELTVYETSNELKQMNVRSLLQISREKDYLKILKVYLLENSSNPQISYYNKKQPLEVFIPEDAFDLQGELINPNAKMGIPIEFLESTSDSKKIDRAFLPGNTEIHIQYNIPAPSLADASFKERMFFEDKDGYKVIFFKPEKMNVTIKNATKIEKLDNPPEAMGALRVGYSNKEIEISVSGGEAISKNVDTRAQSISRIVKNGTLFDTTPKSAAVLVGVLALLFSLSFIFVYRKIS